MSVEQRRAGWSVRRALMMVDEVVEWHGVQWSGVEWASVEGSE